MSKRLSEEVNCVPVKLFEKEGGGVLNKTNFPQDEVYELKNVEICKYKLCRWRDPLTAIIFTKTMTFKQNTSGT